MTSNVGRLGIGLVVVLSFACEERDATLAMGALDATPPATSVLREPDDPAAASLRMATIEALGRDAPAEYAIVRGAARNRAHALTLRFDRRGVSVEPDASADETWSMRIRVERVGRPGVLHQVDDVTPRSEANRVTYAHARGIDEWYVNATLGLEQGVTLRERPDGSGELVVEVALDGLNPTIEDGGASVALRDDEGREVRRYGQLFARDASGRMLASAIDVVRGRVALRVDDSSARYPVVIDPLVWRTQQRLTASDGHAGDWFGQGCLALDGDTAFVGAAAHASNDGQVYVFARSGASWVEQQRIPSPASGAQFGSACALQGDVAVVGAIRQGSYAGAAYVYARTGSTWAQQQLLLPADAPPSARFGNALALEGDTLVIGAWGESTHTGSAYVFARSDGTWAQTQKLVAPDPTVNMHFGVDLALDADTLVVCADALDTAEGIDAGGAFVYTRDGATWLLQHTVTASDGSAYGFFGASVDVAGTRIVIGAPFRDTPVSDAGAVYVFDLQDGSWTETAILGEGAIASDGVFDYFGFDVAAQNDRLLVGAHGYGNSSGAVFVFERSGATWVRRTIVTTPSPVIGEQLGRRVALDGDIGLAGALTSPGSVYPLELGGPQKIVVTPPDPTNVGFGQSVSIDGDTAFVGAPWRNGNRGYAHWFNRTGDDFAWHHTVGSNGPFTAVGDGFGFSVDIDGDLAIVGEPGKDQHGDSSGAVSVYVRTGSSWTADAYIGPQGPGPTGQGFGGSVSVSGETLLIGAQGISGGRGGAAVMVRNGAFWELQGSRLEPTDAALGDACGVSVALAPDLAIVGCPGDDDPTLGSDAGSVFVYERSGTVWAETARLVAADGDAGSNFGQRVETDGTRIIVGAPGHDHAGVSGSGGTYVFVRSGGGAWVLETELVPSDQAAGDAFGIAVAIDGDRLVAAASHATRSGLPSAGGAYLFVRSSGVWTERRALDPPDPAAGAHFGASVAVSGATAIIGQYSAEYGAGGDAGSAYLFDLAALAGTPCSDDDACESNHCADGVCCDTACGASDPNDCMACAVTAGAAADGTCAPIIDARTCRAPNGACDALEVCNGIDVFCPADAVSASGTTCRGASDACDAPESCDGASASCPIDVLRPAGFACRPSIGACDLAESCDGASASCPANAVLPDGTDCDEGLVCNGFDYCEAGVCLSNAPPDCDDGNVCTSESCTDPQGCEWSPIAGCCNTDSDCDSSDWCIIATCSSPGGSCTGAPATGCGSLALAWTATGGEPNASLDAAWGDVDRDGDLDLYVAGWGGTERLYENTGGALVETPYDAVTSDSPYGVAFGDVDGDGDLDLAVGNHGNPSPDQPNRVYRNGTGALESLPAWESALADNTVGIAWGDLNGDGILDLAVGNGEREGGEAPNRVYLGDGTTLSTTAAWTSSEIERTYAVAWGDVDGDGDLDLAAANVGAPLRLWRNDEGTLTASATWSSTEADDAKDLGWGDVDRDGDLDLVVAVDRGRPLRLYRNDSGTLSPSAAWSSTALYDARGVALGDWDGDGDLDVAVGTDGAGASIHRNTGGTLSAAAVWSTGGSDTVERVAFADWNGDGDLDLMTARGNTRARVYENDAPLFASDASETIPQTHDVYGIALGDVDGDLDLDLAVAPTNAPVVVYENLGDHFGPTPLWTSTLTDSSRAVAWGDVDDDGDLDLAVGNGQGYDGYPQENRVYLNDEGSLRETPDWSSAEADSTYEMAWGDVDDDGDLDLATASFDAPVRLYLNDGGVLSTNASWSSPEIGWSIDLAWLDADGDHDLDLAVAQAGGEPHRLYRNDGGDLTLAWTSVGRGNAIGLDVADVDGDGDPDLAIANCCEYQAAEIYRNDDGTPTASPTWSAPVGYARGLAFGDWDGDGDPDLAVSSDFGPSFVFRNEGGTLGATRAWQTSEELAETWGAAWGDLDHDGDLDLAVGSRFAPLRVYRNNLFRPADLPETPTRGSRLGLVMTPSTPYGMASARRWPARATLAVHLELFDDESDDAPSVRLEWASFGSSIWNPASVFETTAHQPADPDGWVRTYTWRPLNDGALGRVVLRAVIDSQAPHHAGHPIQRPAVSTTSGAFTITECRPGFDACCTPQGEIANEGTVCRPSAGACDAAETCDGVSHDCPADVVANAGTECRASAGSCDVAESCDGASPQCPSDTFVDAGTECRPSQGACDFAELCDGASPECPFDALESEGVVCRPAEGDCDVDETCDGASPACPTDAVATTSLTCRGSTGACDPVETCDGVGIECPADAFALPSTICRSAVGVCDSDEYCTGFSEDCPNDSKVVAATVCRASSGICDVAEMCDGVSDACPSDGLASAATVCRTSAGSCDPQESCTGTSVDCPADARAPAATVCRASAGICDAVEVCDGVAAACPSDVARPSGTLCRGVSGICDQAEYCDGASVACPANQWAPSTTVCRTASGACDVAETCTGTSPSCPANGFASSATVCRASASACDAAETCTGTGTTCPANAPAAAGTVCRASAGACDVDETCNGTAFSCPSNTFAPSATLCRASSGECDRDELCTGSSASCPTDRFQPTSVVCRASSGACDVADSCPGNGPTCRPDAVRGTSYTCRASAGPCDLVDKCDGASTECPPDAFRSGNTCRGTAGPCDVAEVCDGSGAACPLDAFRPSTHVCRNASGVCDVAEACTGDVAACPSDGYASAGTTCRAVNGPCDAEEQCTGASRTCPSNDYLPATVVCRAASGPCDQAELCRSTAASCPADRHLANGTVCDDGLACTDTGLCAGGVCGGLDPVSCDDANACTLDSCAEPTASCDHAPTGIPGALAWWRAEDDATDSVSSHDGSLVGGATFAAGHTGRAFSFGVVGAAMQAPATALPVGNADRTLALWVRMDAVVAGEAHFAGYGAFGTGGGSYSVGASGTQLFFSQWGQAVFGPNLDLARWYHVAVTNVGDAVTLYVDGAVVGSGARSISTVAGDVLLGHLDPTRRLSGALDEVVVYGRALAPSEIAALYTSGVAGSCGP